MKTHLKVYYKLSELTSMVCLLRVETNTKIHLLFGYISLVDLKQLNGLDF